MFGVATAVIVIGMIAMIASGSIRPGEFFKFLGGLNPRMLSLAVLPFVIVLFVAGTYLRRKKQDRMWKEALMKTRARKRQREAAGQTPGDGQRSQVGDP